jgi:hypothetical protein
VILGDMLLPDAAGSRLRSIYWEEIPMRSRTRTTAPLAAVALAAGAGVAALAGPAHAAQTTLPITCDGQQLAVRVNTSHSSANGGWAVAQIVDGGTGHLVPTAFSNSLHDDTTNQTLFTFDRAKGGGNANHNQPTVTCTLSKTGTLGDFLNPGDTPPPGTSVSDAVTFTLSVTAIRHS